VFYLEKGFCPVSSSKIIIPINLESLAFDGELLVGGKNNKYGYFNQFTGKAIVPMDYDSFDDFVEGYTVSYKYGKKGVIDSNGNILLPSIYEEVYPEKSDAVIRVKNNSKFGFFDLKGIQIAKFEYEDMPEFEAGYAPVMKGNKWGMIDRKNSIVLPIDYELAKGLEPTFKLTTAKKNFVWYLYDMNTMNLLAYDFKDENGAAENPTLTSGLIKVQKNGLFGYINDNGKLIIPCQYKKANHFNDDGIATVSKDGKLIQKINTKGVVVK
jgi:hypothetical protein